MPTPATGEVHVWSVALDLPPAGIARIAKVLATDELQRAAEIRSEDARRRFLITRAALRLLLGRHLERDPAELTFGAGPSGKPRLAPDSPLAFNVSHSGDLALIALARDMQIGVDVEWLDPRRDTAGVAKRLFTNAERAAIRAAGPQAAREAFYRHWVAKEAFVKAVARNVMSVRSFEVVLEAPGGTRLVHVGGDPAEAGRWTLAELDLPTDGYVGAVAAEGEATIGPVTAFDPVATIGGAP
jgi:4'-phosphopantetheinyl transferase